MTKLGIKGNVEYVTKNHHRYWLLKNPFSKHPIKLLPRDILSNLPMADCVGSIIHDLAEHNTRLRDIINKDIAYIWFETTKAERKEMLLSELKSNKSFFIENRWCKKTYKLFQDTLKVAN